ncbi:MAG: NUDIX domain-containing protein [Actinomycetota bacterium]|nr:NUDIX domain-containing protein [Actinomycetota bacterium]
MTHRVAVYVILRSADGRVLFMLRDGTGYRDGEYGLPSGKAEQGESLVGAAVREVREEIGLELDPESLQLVHAGERAAPGARWLDFFFTCDRWDGEPVNAEPHKCAGLAWLPPSSPGVIAYLAAVIARIDAGVAFSTHADDR